MEFQDILGATLGMHLQPNSCENPILGATLGATLGISWTPGVWSPLQKPGKYGNEFHGNVRGKVRVNLLALFASKPHILMCGALKLFRIVRANVRLNFAIPILFGS